MSAAAATTPATSPSSSGRADGASFWWLVARAIAATGSGAAGLWLALQCVMWGFIHIDGANREDIALAAAAADSVRLASIVTEHVARGVNAADVALRLARAGLRTGAPLDLLVAQPVTRGDALQRWARFDARGHVADATPARTDPFAGLMSHNHLQAHRASGRDVLFVGGVQSHDGRRTLSLSRALRTADDGFEGALVGTLDVDRLMQPYDQTSLRTGAVALLGANGKIIARAGRRDLSAALVQGAVNDDTCHRNGPARSPQDTLVCGVDATSPQDARLREGGLRVVVVASMAAVLGPVQRHRRRLSLGAALITLFSLPLLATSILRQVRLTAAENALERAQRRASNAARDLRYALDSMSHGLMLLDVRGAIVVFNDRALRLLGFASTEPPPRHNDDVVRRLDGPEDDGENDRGKNDGGPCLRDAMRLDVPRPRVFCPGPDGRYLVVRTRRLPEGGYVRTIENATRRHHNSLRLAQARDAAEAASRARGYFLARMSHEIRTPLHAVMGFTRLLRERPLDADAAALLAQVSAASDHLITVVDDVLDLSLVDSGRLRLQDAPFHLASLLERLAPIAEMARDGKAIAFRWSVAADLPPWLAGDERRLFQILVNLVDNAFKFTDDGDVAVEAMRDARGDAPRLRITVRDTGRGVDPETVTALFETFARGPGTDGTPGAGLGLAIVKQLVDLMGGALDVARGARGGASFGFTLPLRPAEPPQAQGNEHPQPTRSLRVLLADDTPSSLLLAQAMLEARGLVVVAVSDGLEALDAFQRARFDLVLLDLQMPNLGGLDAVARMRAAEARGEASGARTFIAALTAQGQAGASGVAGMDAVLLKPFGAAELDALLARAGAAQAPNLV